MSTPWSPLGSDFLSDGSAWSVGQGVDAPDRQLMRALVKAYCESKQTQEFLEVGFGPGIDIDGMEASRAMFDVRYQGWDATPELVDRARESWPDYTFRVRDIVTDMPTDLWDFVWCRHVLEHVSDGERALANLWRATRGVLLISWFIRPTFAPSEVGCVVGDGFDHWTYDAPRWITLCREMGAHLYRFDVDHHLNRGSIWLLSREPQPELAQIAHTFFSSPEFLAACIPVPHRANEPYEDALDGAEEALAALDAAIPVAERLDAALYVVGEARDALTRAETLLERSQDEPDTASVIGPVRDAKARCEIILASGAVDGDLTVAQALRDAARRIEARLQDAGRLDLSGDVG